MGDTAIYNKSTMGNLRRQVHGRPGSKLPTRSGHKIKWRHGMGVGTKGQADKASFPTNTPP